MSRAFPFALLVAIATLVIVPVNCGAFQIPSHGLPKSFEEAILPTSRRPSLRPPEVDAEPSLPTLEASEPVNVPPRDTYGYDAPEPIWGVGASRPLAENQSAPKGNVYRPPAKRLKSQQPDFTTMQTVPSRPIETLQSPPGTLGAALEPVSERLGDMPASQLVTPTQAPPALPTQSSERKPISILRSPPRRGPIVENLSDMPLTLAKPGSDAAQKSRLMAEVAPTQTAPRQITPRQITPRQITPRQNASALSPPTEPSTSPTAPEAPSILVNNDLRIRVLAPELMLESQPNEMTIEVLNLSPNTSTPVEVKVRVPDELTITRFDRDAWLDDKERVIVFPVPAIPGRHKQSIRLRGVSYSSGQHQLNVVLVDDQKTLDQTKLAFGVVNQATLMRNAATERRKQEEQSTPIQR